MQQKARPTRARACCGSDTRGLQAIKILRAGMRRTNSQWHRRADEHDRLTQYQRRIQPAVWSPAKVLTHFIRTESDSSTGDFEFSNDSKVESGSDGRFDRKKENSVARRHRSDLALRWRGRPSRPTQSCQPSNRSPIRSLTAAQLRRRACHAWHLLSASDLQRHGGPSACVQAKSR